MSGDVRRFHILGVLGEGGFGIVYLADLLGAGGFSRRVALKVLRPEAQGAAGLARLRDEARMLGVLRHRGIVAVDELLLLGGRWTVVMELVDGVDLFRLGRPMPPGTVCEVVHEVAQALAAAWDEPNPTDGRPLRVLHRDIKPPNLILTRSGGVKVLDFGIARAELAGREADTKSYFLGSPGYMAPERFDGREEHQGDVYSLGVVAFELACLENWGQTSARPERHEALRSSRLVRLADVAPPEVVALVARCTAYEPSARPSARELAREARELRQRSSDPWLADWAAGVVPSVVPRPPTLDPWVGTTVVTGEAPRPPEVVPAIRPRGEWVGPVALAATGVLGLSGALLVVVLVAVGGGAWWWGSPAEAPVPVPVPASPIAVEPEAPPPVTVVPEPVEPPPTPAPARPVRVPPPRTVGAAISLAGGATEAVLVGADGERFTVPGAIPRGTYRVRAQFEGVGWVDAGQVVIYADAPGALRCDPAFLKCVLGD